MKCRLDRKGEVRERGDVEKQGCRRREMHKRRDAGEEEDRKGRMQESGFAGKEIFRNGGMEEGRMQKEGQQELRDSGEKKNMKQHAEEVSTKGINVLIVLKLSIDIRKFT